MTMGKAMREIYGQALADYGAPNERVVVLDADLSSSSKTSVFGAAAPERLLNVGIAEANMAAMAAGLASCGFIPFVNTFAALADSICYLCAKAMIAYSNLNVRIVGSNNGLGGGYDGSTHHATDDLSVMRNIPGMLVITPSDAVMARWMVKTLIYEYTGPAYLSMERHGGDDIYADDSRMRLGKAIRLTEGEDLSIFACGLSVGRALKAAEILHRDGINAQVYDMFTIKPLDRQTVIDSSAHTGRVLTVEEHSIIGGLGTAVLETIAENGICAKVRRIGIRDCYTESGSYEQLVEKYGLGIDAIVSEARELMEGE